MRAHQDAQTALLRVPQNDQQMADNITYTAIETLVSRNLPCASLKAFPQCVHLFGGQPTMQVKSTESDAQFIVSTNFRSQPNVELIEEFRHVSAALGWNVILAQVGDGIAL